MLRQSSDASAQQQQPACETRFSAAAATARAMFDTGGRGHWVPVGMTWQQYNAEMVGLKARTAVTARKVNDFMFRLEVDV